ncbi:MAG TPA: class I SAM-dependent methyltransferase [Roseiflexaceae bacterium]
MAHSIQPVRRANYGLDAPGLVRGFLLGGAALIALGLAARVWAPNTIVFIIGSILLWPGAIFFGEGILMVWSSRVGKFHERDRLLDGLDLRGDEAVLDVGPGHGLLLIGAAKRLPRGRAVGIDLWSQVDQADNSRTALLANAQIEGVADRVKVHDGDMCEMPFAEASFDAVVASLAIHNIPDRAGRDQAVREIVRVLKPGGVVALLDFRHTGEYAETLRAAGLQDVRASSLSFWMFPPVRIVTAAKR